MSDKLLTVLVTIHGIGFQQTPQFDLSSGTPVNLPGYADKLHQSLYAFDALKDILGGDTDPDLKLGRKSEDGPIYVNSHWPPNSEDTEKGVSRLGIWHSDDDKQHRLIDIEKSSPIRQAGKQISHVALVYSKLEDQGLHLGSTLELLGNSIANIGKYTDLWGGIKTLGGVISGLVGQDKNKEATPSLSVRKNVLKDQNKPKNPSGLGTVVGQLDKDVATYVFRNDLRDRVRSFAHEAILRLCCREDVGQIIINAHSQGTVVAFDVLRQLPPFAASKVKILITAGSPLRKYATFFSWGMDASCIYEMNWHNVWDNKDPVADPLVPGLTWKRGDKLEVKTGPQQSDLFYYVDQTGSETEQARSDAIIKVSDNNTFIKKINITEIRVDNVQNTIGSGLSAHNYWDNEKEFIPMLAELLQLTVDQAPMIEGKNELV